MKKLENILRNKSKNELQVISKNIGLKGYYKLSKEKLIGKLLSNGDLGRLHFELGLQKSVIKNQWFQGFIFLILSSIVGYFFYINSPSKQDLDEIITVIDKNEEYAKEIEFLEKYKKKFLENQMDLNYSVFGIRNNEIVTKENLMNPDYPLDYYGNIEFDYDKGIVNLTLSNLNLFLTNQNTLIKGFNSKEIFPIKEDIFYSMRGMVFKENSLKFVLLKMDKEQPVFAIGLSSKR